MGIGTLRFCLSLLVIDSHYGLFGRWIQLAAVNRFGVDRLAYVGSGGIAVSGFFVISGYLITLVLTRKYDAGWHGAKAFYLSRALRIYPLYGLVFACYWIALRWQDAAPAYSFARWLGNLTLIPYGIVGMAADENAFGLATTDALLIGPAWTLCYDLLFYVLAPWLFVRARTCWWVAILGFAYFVAFVLFADPRPPVWFQFFYGTGMPYLFMFACGALAYHYRASLRFGWGGAGLLVGGLCWVTYFPLGLSNTYLNGLVAVLLYTPLVATLGQAGPDPRVDRVLGDLTYATYLIHLPLLLVASRLGWPSAPMWALALTYVVSIALLLGFEYPLDRLRDRLYARSGQGRAGARAARMTIAIPAAIGGLLLAAGMLSAWNNLWRAGTDVELRAVSCPQNWHCDKERIAFDGAGQVELAPAFAAGNRVVVDLGLEAASGGVWAGVESEGGGFRVGIRRVGDACHLESADGQRVEGDPPGWSVDCRPRRLVFNRAGDRMNVVVDSLWSLPSVSTPARLHVVARAEEGSQGALTLPRMFVSRR